MTRLILAFLTAAFASLAANAANAAFDVTYNDGTRDDVRAYCEASAGVLSDREDYTMCVSAVVPGATYTCDDAEQCIRTGFDLVSTGSVRVPGQSVSPAGFPEPHYTPNHYEGGVQMIPSGKTFRQLPYTGFGGLELVE
jgi:hypothetical protein